MESWAQRRKKNKISKPRKLQKENNQVGCLILKLIKNSSKKIKENLDRDGVWISNRNRHRFLRF